MPPASASAPPPASTATAQFNADVSCAHRYAVLGQRQRNGLAAAGLGLRKRCDTSARRLVCTPPLVDKVRNQPVRERDLGHRRTGLRACNQYPRLQLLTVPPAWLSPRRLSGFGSGPRRGKFRRQSRRRRGVWLAHTTSRQRRMAPKISPALRVDPEMGLIRRCKCSPYPKVWLRFAPRLSPISGSTRARPKARQPPRVVHSVHL